MKKGVLIGVIISVVLILVVGFFVLTNSKGNNPDNGSNNLGTSQNSNSNTEMVNCGKMDNPSCFSNRLSGCLPVTGTLTATDGSPIELTILGQVNETCHFQRKVNNVLNLDCYFPIGSMNWDTIDQTFGNDHGLQQLVDDNCKPVIE